MLTMVHSNGARIEGGLLRVDRKFLTGMRRYAEQIDAPLLTVHPALSPDANTMDMVEAPCQDLGFEVMTLDEYQPTVADAARFRARIAASELVVGGGMGASRIARALRVPYILVLEYDLQTQMIVTASQVASPLRQWVRRARCAAGFYLQAVPEMRAAAALHCNGFPVYEEAGRYNAQRLLYLDSRMSADMVIPEAMLQQRLAARPGRTVRLLFSGRYEPMKGAIDTVRVGLECLKRGLDVELHCYGQGGQRDEMRALAAQAAVPGRIQVHDAVSYPELVERSRGFDVFVCCHIQSDPSCTYLESFGAGLPIVGYANRMWRGLCDTSGCGHASPLGEPGAVADDVARLLAEPATLDALSVRAREFALAHTFEREFALRTQALGDTLRRLRSGRAQVAAA